jgi:hypothetical protein
MRLGVIGDGPSMAAHAWLEVDGRPLEDTTGYGVFESVDSRQVRA